ncbi:YdcF family protein [Janthinobacterium fluminis]|uniref:YdcF family protein n=1 Tax=Janthinobacterium fluminis TaxID=2987524 RepID=A0ABT5K0B4_9BURK|nr:YdcF family protein [Janthinobacterium fluminis]MDC8757197.1 YdcF family protein [Janthinobacterium fluminis]
MKGLKCALMAALLAASGGCALLADGLRDNVQRCDVAIVLGSKVELDGRPSARLAARLDKAAALYRAGLFPRVIVSGGLGKEGYDEAAVMRDYLVAHAVPAPAIIVDSGGVNTTATARNSAALMRAGGLRSAVVVTQYFHIPRTRLALRDSGVATVYSAHADYFEWRDIYSTLREAVALPVYWLAGLFSAAPPTPSD